VTVKKKAITMSQVQCMSSLPPPGQ